MDAEGKPLSITVVGGLPETLEPGESFLVPRPILPRQVWANAPTETVIQVATEQNPGVVAERIERAGIGEVHTVQDWARVRAGRNQAGNVQILSVLMGLAGLYALMAVVNSVVIAGTERRREFAVFRVTGLSRPQVIRTAVAEATAVAIIGLVLGCAVAAAGLAGIGGSVRAAIGVTVVHVPWVLLTVVAAGSLAVVAVTSGITAFLTTREHPVSLITTKE